MPDIADFFSLDDLNRLFLLDEKVGLYWKAREEVCREDKIFNAQFAGKRAGNQSKTSGYVQITMRRKGKRIVLKEHRLVYSMFCHQIISEDLHIDHVDGNRSNNSVLNLRAATASENNCNTGIRSDNSSGHKGVCFAKYAGKWRAIIRFAGKSVHLGYFSSKEDARLAYAAAAEKMHGQFARNA